jgi:hypothetical protein
MNRDELKRNQTVEVDKCKEQQGSAIIDTYHTIGKKARMKGHVMWRVFTIGVVKALVMSKYH